MRSIQLRVILFIVVLLWCAGFSIPLFLDKGSSSVISILLDFIYGPVCHQLPQKSIITESGSFLVCYRCTGIYYGVLAVCIGSLFLKSVKFIYFLPALIFLITDVILVNTGLYKYSPALSFLTGLFFGFTLFPYIFSILDKYLCNNEIT
jgi:uncharacterized membrane protein